MERKIRCFINIYFTESGNQSLMMIIQSYRSDGTKRVRVMNKKDKNGMIELNFEVFSKL